MATTPWEIWGEFNKQLAYRRQTEMETGARYDIANQGVISRQQAATTAYGRQLERDETQYGRQLDRDAATRQAQHEEGFLREVVYPGMKGPGGRRGHVGGGGAGKAAAADSGGSGALSPQSAMNYYVNQRGVPPQIAAGIVGNIAAESGWRESVFSGQERGDSGTAAYAGQWRGVRQQKLVEFAQERGHARPTPQDQLDYFLDEAGMGHDLGAQRAMTMVAGAKTPEEAADIWMHQYERPADDSSLAHRQQAARQAFEGFHGEGGGGATVQTDQRRYGTGGGGGGIPSSEELYSQWAEGQDDDAVLLDPTQRMTPWSPEDFAAAGVDNFEYSNVPGNMDVVGQRFYSSAQFAAMPPEMQERLLAVGGLSPTETNEYLLLQNKPEYAQDPYGYPIDNPEQAAAGGGGVINPAAAAPQPVGQPMTTAGTAAPAVPVSTAPPGRRTRRNQDGVLEFLIDGEWHPAGG